MASTTYAYLYELQAANTPIGSEYKLKPPLTDLTGADGFGVEEGPLSDNGQLAPDEVVTTTGGPSGTWTYLGTVVFGQETYPVFSDGTKLYLASNDQFPNSYTSSVFGIDRECSSPICLCAGTLIATPEGLKPVEALAVGDLVSTPSGARSVRFVGQSTRFLPQLRATGRMPILIEAGALGELGPVQDIYCTPSHAFLLNGCLVEAQALINGTSIRQLQDWKDFSITYYSIELEVHSLVWANGLLTETYFANVRGEDYSRTAWTNYASFVALYGEDVPMKELEMPRIPFSRQLPAELRDLVQASSAKVDRASVLA